MPLLNKEMCPGRNSEPQVHVFVVSIRMYSDISNVNAKAAFWGRKNVLLEVIW